MAEQSPRPEKIFHWVTDHVTEPEWLDSHPGEKYVCLPLVMFSSNLCCICYDSREQQISDFFSCCPWPISIHNLGLSPTPNSDNFSNYRPVRILNSCELKNKQTHKTVTRTNTVDLVFHYSLSKLVGYYNERPRFPPNWAAWKVWNTSGYQSVYYLKSNKSYLNTKKRPMERSFIVVTWDTTWYFHQHWFMYPANHSQYRVCRWASVIITAIQWGRQYWSPFSV